MRQCKLYMVYIDAIPLYRYKYIITDEESKKLNEVYYTTNAYYDPAEGPTPMLMQFIVPNLYGTEYEWAQSI